MLNYPIEYLNDINCTRMPLAKLEVKIGCPIIVLKNLDAAHRLYNGSRGILTRCRNRVLEVELLTGSHAGQKVFTSEKLENTFSYLFYKNVIKCYKKKVKKPYFFLLFCKKVKKVLKKV